ncbi:hypothetical protein PIB30_042234 [Stylosanthes scabra]|uniref:Uncharacterized protein n=1 Tax=Stylosanthes scabra TaxID=79078 RepID=A0ABU6YFS4_9FABA|nr:hypothetical protein [Stylosanthes scabra]
MAANLSHSTSLKGKGKRKKKNEKTPGKETASVSPELLVVVSTAPLTKDGFLKAPEPSIETSELWKSQDVKTDYFKARVFRTGPQQEARTLFAKWKARLRSAYRQVWVEAGINQAL